MCPDAKGSLVVRSASSCNGQHKSVTRGTKVLYGGIGRVAVVTRGLVAGGRCAQRICVKRDHGEIANRLRIASDVKSRAVAHPERSK